MLSRAVLLNLGRQCRNNLMSNRLPTHVFHRIKEQGPVVRKPISLIQDYRKLLFHVFNFLVKGCFAYFCFSRLTSSNVKFCQISTLNSI